MEDSKADLRLDALTAGSVLEGDYFYLLRAFDIQVVCWPSSLCQAISYHVCEVADISVPRVIRWDISGKKYYFSNYRTWSSRTSEGFPNPKYISKDSRLFSWLKI